MHSSRMRTTRSSSHRGVGAWTRSPSTSPLGVGLDLIPLNFPLVCGPGSDPLNFPLGGGPGPDPPQVWAWRDPPQEQTPLWTRHPHGEQTPLGADLPPGDLLQGMLGYHLQCMLGYHLQCMLGYHPRPVDRITDACENITLPQLRCGR